MRSRFILRLLERFFIASIALIASCTLLAPTYLIGEGFVEGTLVVTPQGYTAIDHVSVGDRVVSYNIETGVLEHDVVSRVQQTTIDSFVLITLGETLLAVAPDHRLYCPFEDDRWVMARDITSKHCIAMVPPEAVTVDDVVIMQYAVSAYSLSVQKNHNFFVSEQGILVHNMNPALPAAVVRGIDFLKIFVGLGAVVGASRAHEAGNKGAQEEKHIPPLPFQIPPPAVEAPAKASNEYIAESIKEDLKALDYYSKNYDAKAVSITEIPGQLSQVIIVRNDSDSVNEVVGGEWKTVVLGPDNSFYTATEKASEAIEEIVFPPPLELKKNASAEQEAKQPTYRLKDLEPQRLAPVNPQQAVPVSTFSFKIGIDSGVKQPRAVLDARRAVVRRMAKVFIDSLPEPVARVVLVRTVEEIAKKQGVVADESYFFNNFEDYHHEAYIAFLKTLPGYNKWIIGLKKFLEQDAGPTLLWPPSWFGKNPESERLDAIFSSQNGFDFGAQGAFSKRIEKLFDAVMEQDTAEQLARKQEAEACRQAENQHKEAEARRIANEKQIAEQQAATSRLAEEQEVKEPYQKRSLPRRRNQEVSRAAGNETVLGGDEEKGLIDAPCFPGYDNDENSKRSSDPLRDNVTVLPGSSCVVGGAENIFEAKDPFPFKPSNTSCGWSRQPQLPELGKDENEEGQPALPTSPQGAADKDIKQGTVEQPDQQQGEQDMTGDKEELSRVEEESQEASPVAVDKTVQQEEAEKKQKEGAEGKKQEEPRLSAAEFEKKISKMSPGERVAAVKEMAERVAQGRGLVRDKLSKNISKKNPNRDIYRKADSKGRTEELYSTDTQHGRFEVCNKNGKHLREVDFDFKQTKGPDLSGKHDLIVK